MLSLYKLEIFSVVVQYGSFSAAAEHLHMSQPAVSQHIQDLERSLGTELFIRGRRGVRLTPSGEKLYAHTTQILAMVAAAEHDVMNVANLASGHAIIGATPNVGIYSLPEWIRNFREHYPNVTLALQTGTTNNIVQGVLNHQLDIGFVEGELDKIRRSRLGVLVLRDIEMVLVVGPKHKWWQRESVAIDELKDQAFVMRQRHSQTRIWLDEVLQQHNIIPIVSAEFDNPESIKQSVFAGICISVLPTYAVEADLEAKRLHAVSIQDVTLRRTLKLVWDRQVSLSPIARTFLSFLMEQFPQLSTLFGGMELA
ncbi:MAG: LysR family transcriptional regulator [Phototrophicales bacterium]|nr:MAG: LysR family transcriptional regulator [Phototrophicales bacterium]